MIKDLSGEKSLSFLVFLIPITALTVKDAISAIFTILAIWGLYLQVKRRKDLVPFDKDIYPILWAFAGIFIVDVLAYVFADYHAAHIGALDGGLRFLLLIPILSLLLFYGIKEDVLQKSIILAAIVVGIVALMQSIVLPTHYVRAQGIIHPIIFGDVAMLLAIMNLAYMSEHKGPLQKIHLLAICFAFMASILSGTRGAWLALPVMLLVFIFIKRHDFSTKKISLVVASFIFLISTAYFTPQTKIKPRIDRIIKEVQVYQESAISSKLRMTSSGARLEMWQAAWTMFLENPILGVGTRNYFTEATKQASEGRRNKIISKHGLYHAHNDYLWFMAEKGVLGLIAVLAVFVLPFKYFYQSYRNKGNDAIALMGMLIISAFMVMSLTEALFARNTPKTFYILMVAILLALSIRSKLQDSSSSKLKL